MSADVIKLNPGTRPEVGYLSGAVDNALMVITNVSAQVEPVVLLPVGVARDLLDILEDNCAEHLRCEACGEKALCKVCCIGQPDQWCPHQPLCPDCRFEACDQCNGQVS